MHRIASLAVFILVAPALAEAPFRDLSFDDACKAAKKDSRIVMIDFYTTWCPPCKKLDLYTWSDKSVQKWLGEKTIPLKVDAERERKLAERYKVQAYPTMVFLRPDGTEILRLIGFRETPQFLSEVRSLSVTAAAPPEKPAPANAPSDPNARMRAAEALAQQGRHKEALDEYLWCFDHGKEQDPAFHGVRLSFLLDDIARLGRSYPPANDALKRRRDAARDLLLTGKGSFDAASDFASLSREFKDVQGILAVFDKLPRNTSGAAAALAVLLDEVLDQLVLARRYNDIVSTAGDIHERVDRALEMSRSTTERARKDPFMKSAADYMKQQAIVECGNYYEALAGTKRADDAQKLASRLIDFENSSRTYITLIKAARRAGSADAAAALLERAKSLPESERRRVESAR